MDIHTPVVVKREPMEPNSLPVLPYIRRFKLIMPPVKTEKCSTPPPDDRLVRALCPREIIVPLRRIKSYSKSTPVKRNVHSATDIKQSIPIIRYRGNLIQTAGFHILLKRGKIYTKCNPSSRIERFFKKVLDKKTVTPIPATQIEQDSRKDSFDSQKFRDTISAVNSVRQGWNSNMKRSIKAEPVVEVESNPVPKPVIYNSRQLEIEKTKALLERLVIIKLRRIDDNILFHIKINNPQAVLPMASVASTRGTVASTRGSVASTRGSVASTMGSVGSTRGSVAVASTMGSVASTMGSFASTLSTVASTRQFVKRPPRKDLRKTFLTKLDIERVFSSVSEPLTIEKSGERQEFFNKMPFCYRRGPIKRRYNSSIHRTKVRRFRG